MNVLILILGLILVIVGAEFMVNGSVAVAKRYRMPEFLIGLTIVGIGTSMPEMVVSLFAGIDGSGSIAIGNVIGSNLANTLLILGISGLIHPISISPTTRRTDIPYNLFVTVVLLVMCFGFTFWKSSQEGIINRWEGIILLALFAGYMTYSFRSSKREDIIDKSDDDGKKPPMEMWKAFILIFAGLAGLIWGGRWFVTGATGIALSFGISETIIAITIVAVGTSLPELATSVVAAVKGKTQLALGNIIGSNIFNICLILGVTSLVKPIPIGGILQIDILVPIAAAIMLWIAIYTFRGRRINRADSVIFLLGYVGYVVYLILR